MARDTDPVASWGERAIGLIVQIVGPSALIATGLVVLSWLTTYSFLYAALFGLAAFVLAQVGLMVLAVRRSASGRGPFAEPVPSDSASQPAATGTDFHQAQEAKIERLETVIRKQQERLNRYDGRRLKFKGLLQDAHKEGFLLRDNGPSKEDVQEWGNRVSDLLRAAVGDWLEKRVMKHEPGYVSGDMEATTEQAWLDARLRRLQDLTQWVESQDGIPFRHGFDPHEWKDWKSPPGDELKRRCAELAEELTKFLDAWENYRDQQKIFPDKPGDWPRYTMEEYRRKNYERRLAALLDDLERYGLLTAEARAHFRVPTDDPQTIREVEARLRGICHRY